MWHTIRMPWVAYFHPKFKAEFDEKKFYKRLIEKADNRYKEHLDNL
jgi:hypothetical protein